MMKWRSRIAVKRNEELFVRWMQRGASSKEAKLLAEAGVEGLVEVSV